MPLIAPIPIAVFLAVLDFACGQVTFANRALRGVLFTLSLLNECHSQKAEPALFSFGPIAAIGHAVGSVAVGCR